MQRITWNGDFSNEPKAGVILSEDGGMARIQWDDGTSTLIPSAMIVERNGWRRM